jgi:ankyrin repeat protein
MSLDLANELLYCVSETLESERDINTFAQANHRLYHLLNNYLYFHNIHQSGSSALLWAAKHGQEAAVRKLLDERANLEATNKYDQTPLLWAAEYGHEVVVKLLLDKGANLDAQGRLYGTALYLASARGDEQVVKLLLNKGADVDAQVGYHGNALQTASYGGHEQVVKLLFDKGANINAQGDTTATHSRRLRTEAMNRW